MNRDEILTMLGEVELRDGRFGEILAKISAQWPSSQRHIKGRKTVGRVYFLSGVTCN
jgi:hypothetical protein